MYAIGMLAVIVAGYFAFSKTKEGAGLLTSLGEALLVAALFVAILSGTSAWLSGAAIAAFVPFSATLIGLSFATALLGALGASLSHRRHA
jgi:hypothetical protein